jgi:transcriptional regulator with XRE-family HTH domain
MDAARVLRQARLRAGLTQRQLGEKAGVPQSMIGRVEARAVIPRVDTLDRLLEACGEGLESVPRPGRGVDRTLFTAHLPPTERARLAVESDRNIMELRRRVRRATPVRPA